MPVAIHGPPKVAYHAIWQDQGLRLHRVPSLVPRETLPLVARWPTVLPILAIDEAKYMLHHLQVTKASC